MQSKLILRLITHHLLDGSISCVMFTVSSSQTVVENLDDDDDDIDAPLC